MTENQPQNEFPEVEEGSLNTTASDIRNSRLLFLNQVGYTLGLGVVSVAAWGFMVWCLWNSFVAPALSLYSITYVNAMGLALFLMAIKRMGRGRPQWSRRPMWFECNDEVRRGLIIDDIQNGVVKPILYAGVGLALAYFSSFSTTLGY